MNSVLLTKELTREMKGFVIGSSIVSGYLLLTMIIYSSMAFSMDQITAMWSTLPEDFMKALNYDPKQWESVLGFYSTYFVFYIPVISGGFSVVWGLKMLAKEEYQKTAEFLMTRPISRNSILSSKLVALVSYITAINLVGYVTALITCTIFGKTGFDVGSLTILHLYGLTVCLFLGMLGLFISVWMRRGKPGAGIGIGIVLGYYLLDMLLKIYGKADFLLYLTPFHYINLDVTLPGYRLEAWRILIPLAASILMVIVVYGRFRRKDIYT